MTGPLIDAHQHFWNPARGDYGWMPADDPILSRTYGPADLIPALAETGVAHTVLVQAAESVEETEYMLGIADCTPQVGRVVGWVNFEQRSHLHVLRRLARHPKFAGVRPMIQDIADDDWMLRDDVSWTYRAICDLDLTFDALGFPRHLDRFHTLLTRYKDMRVVLDHCLKPQIGGDDPQAFRTWAEGMARLAGDTGALCKLSGLVTEAPMLWTDDMLRPYVDHVLRVFGPDRVMWGSDWPVSRLRCDYGDWHAAARRLTGHLDATAQAAIFGGTAAKFYGIETEKA